jgi:hypothetical protein
MPGATGNNIKEMTAITAELKYRIVVGELPSIVIFLRHIGCLIG